MSPTLVAELSTADPDDPFVWELADGARSFSLNRGRNTELDQIQPGTASVVLDNRDGAWIASNAAGPWYPDLRPLNGLRLSAITDDGSAAFVMRSSAVRSTDELRGGSKTLVLFTGYTTSAGEQSYDPAPDATVLLSAVDALKLLTVTTNWGYYTPAPPYLSGSWIVTALERFNDVTFVAWPADLRNLDAGAWSDQESRTLGYDTLAYCIQIADSEGGVFFADVYGRLTFHDRNHSYPMEITPYGDTAGEHRYTGITVDPGTDDHVYNQITVTAPGGNPTNRTASDATSAGHYFARDKQLDSALNTGADMQTRADELLARYKDPHARITALTIRAGDWSTILSKELYDRVTVKLHRPDGSVLTQTSRIEGIAVASSEANDWSVTWALSEV